MSAYEMNARRGNKKTKKKDREKEEGIKGENFAILVHVMHLNQQQQQQQQQQQPACRSGPNSQPLPRFQGLLSFLGSSAG